MGDLSIEGHVTGCVDNQQPRQLELLLCELLAHHSLHSNTLSSLPNSQNQTEQKNSPEGLVTRCVDNQQPRQLELLLCELLAHLCLLEDGFARDVGGSDLLRDAARLAVLDVGAPQLVQDLCFPRVDVAQHTDHRATQVVRRYVLLVIRLAFLKDEATRS
jgi:hypothetical protein